jgi:DHA2 family integral membrane protein (MFS transporter)
MLSSLYSTDLNRKLPANVPTQVRDAADQSVGAALQVSARLGRLGAPLADAARESFVYAMARASLVTAVVAVVGALLAWRFLPARPTEVETREVDVDAVDECELAEVG